LAPDAKAVEAEVRARGRAAVRQAYEQQWFPSMISFRGETTSLTVAASGDLAYETGTNHLQVKGPQGPTAATSKYLLVWRRDADRQWRVAAISVTNSPT
jgi:ketosteroid isomerase-like protein